jgi:hypothetical protein
MQLHHWSVEHHHGVMPSFMSFLPKPWAGPESEVCLRPVEKPPGRVNALLEERRGRP